MQLRSITRRPGRYREEEIPDLPTPPRFVHNTIPFDSNLPEAAFPTLDPCASLYTSVESLVVESAPTSDLSESEDMEVLSRSQCNQLGGPPQSRAAVVFRSRVAKSRKEVMVIVTPKSSHIDDPADPLISGDFHGKDNYAEDDERDREQGDTKKVIFLL
jgi:hypothetical protein